MPERIMSTTGPIEFDRHDSLLICHHVAGHQPPVIALDCPFCGNPCRHANINREDESTIWWECTNRDCPGLVNPRRNSRES